MRMLLDPDHEGTTVLRKVGTYLPSETAYPRRLACSITAENLKSHRFRYG
jgi:hypothetical protein